MTDTEFRDFLIGLKIIDQMDWSQEAIKAQMEQIKIWFRQESQGASEEEIAQLTKIKEQLQKQITQRVESHGKSAKVRKPSK